MPAAKIDDPFLESRVEEVKLQRSPLRLVLFQVRFPSPVTIIEEAISSGAIARALSAAFPFAEQQNVLEFVFQPGQPGPAQRQTNSVALSLSDAAQKWRLDVARDSISLTTTAYEDRDNLLERVRAIFDAMGKVAPPPAISRIGLRYINRIDDVSIIRDLCTSGGLADIVSQQQQFSLATPHVRSSISELQYAWPTGARLQARWGLLPEGPNVVIPLEPLAVPSWLLDIDAYSETRFAFSSETVVDELKSLSERAYRYFRWFFTPTALPRFGAVE